MSLPAGWLPVPLDPDGGLPQAAPLPAPDSDLRLVLVAAAPDLAALLGARPDRIVWSSRDALDRGRGSDAVSPLDIRQVAAGAALAALTAPAGETLSPAQVRVVVLVLGGGRVLAARPALPGPPVAVLDGGRLRGHLWTEEVTVSAGSLVAAGATGVRISFGWRGTTAGPGDGTPGAGPAPLTLEELYAHLD